MRVCATDRTKGFYAYGNQKSQKKFAGKEIMPIFAIPLRKNGIALSLKNNFAEIAQLVEHNLAKVGVASSSLVFRSREEITFGWSLFLLRKVSFATRFPLP